MSKTPIPKSSKCSAKTCIRAIACMLGVSTNTVSKLLVGVENACATFHEDVMRGVKAKRIQCVEIGSFTYAK